METNESIAYEIAMLVKENRELREQLKDSENKYHDLLHEYDNVCRIIEEERLKSKPARKQREYNLYDAPHEIEHGSKIVITECFGNEAKFPKGFVMKVSSISKNAAGIITITGKYQILFKACGTPADHKCSGERTTKICNKFYNWKISTGNLSTIDETTFDKRQYIGLVEV